MRLLNSRTLQLEEFLDVSATPYAILSHTWGSFEVSFQEMQSPTPQTMQKAGYLKIQGSCALAAADGFEYVWIDTCCIDKTSSSELSEAINSMYRWYRDADVCYVYLTDVHWNESTEDRDAAFALSRWFTRGWTLQELIAPISVIFFDAGWKEIGTKLSLIKKISDITGIHNEALLCFQSDSYSVAQRMSWASNRETTRAEDKAYCLMGIFGINMPMLYGEGDKAFLRLQHEIIKLSDDHSIFAWNLALGIGAEPSGFLAKSPSMFSNCQSVTHDHSKNADRVPFEITNRGIRLQLPGTVQDDDPSWNFWPGFVVLDCVELGKPNDLLCLNVLKSTSTKKFQRANSYFRGFRSVDLQRPTIKRDESDALDILTIYTDETEENFLPKTTNLYTDLLIHMVDMEEVVCVSNRFAPKGPQKELCSAISFAGARVILDFACVDGSGDTFSVAVLRQDLKMDIFAVEPVIRPKGRKFENLFIEYLDAKSIVQDVVLPTDRATWQLPEKSWHLTALIKKQIIAGARAVVLFLEKHEGIIEHLQLDAGPEESPSRKETTEEQILGE